MPPQLITVKGVSIVLVHEDYDTIKEVFIPQRVRVNELNYTEYIKHIDNYTDYRFIQATNTMQAIYFTYEELLNHIVK